jgi:hypothetical protein
MSCKKDRLQLQNMDFHGLPLEKKNKEKINMNNHVTYLTRCRDYHSYNYDTLYIFIPNKESMIAPQRNWGISLFTPILET